MAASGLQNDANHENSLGKNKIIFFWKSLKK
jgi:hypothetical protein